MALSKEIKDQSFTKLSSNSDFENTQYNRMTLSIINELAAQYDVFLSEQGKSITQKLLSKIEKSNLDLDIDEDRALLSYATENGFEFNAENKSSLIKAMLTDYAERIYWDIDALISEQADLNRRAYARNAGYKTVGLDKRFLHDQMEDHDVTLVMPASTDSISVMGPWNQFDPLVREAMVAALKADLDNPNIHHVLIPMGPGHWRGVYIAKPQTKESNYTVEIFDPYGPAGARGVENYVRGILTNCGLAAKDTDFKFIGPLITQKDGYACGDFTCSYTHKKMLELGVAYSAHGEKLVKVLDATGNQEDSLRKAMREVTRSLLNQRQGIVEDTPSIAETNTQESEDEGKKAENPTPKAPIIDVPVKKVEPVKNEDKPKPIEPPKKDATRVKRINSVRKALIPMSTKIKEFSRLRLVNKDYLSAMNAMKHIKTQVEDLCTQYEFGAIKLIDFKDQVHDLITNEESNELKVLDQHRGWKDIVVNILAAISTLGLAHVFYAVACGQFTLFHTPTHSRELIQDLDTTLEGIVPLR